METAPTMKMMTRPRAHALCLAALLTLTAACGNDQSGEPPATSAPVLNTPPVTVLPPTTSPATTAPATQPPTTTPAPSSTTPLVDETKQAVIDAAEHAWHTFNEAKLDPTNPAKVEAALAAHTGNCEGSRSVDHRRSTWHPTGSRSHPTSCRARSTIVVETRRSHDRRIAAGTATVDSATSARTCMVEIAGNPDGSDRVLDDTVNAYRDARDLRARPNGAVAQVGRLESSRLSRERSDVRTRASCVVIVAAALLLAGSSAHSSNRR